jgi:hypothetical protein
VHLCYVDDSGADQGRTVTGLLIPEEGWSDLLHHWLEGRRKLESEWGVLKNSELHANALVKGRGRFCGSNSQDRKFHGPARLAAHELMLRHLAKCESLRVLTVGGHTRFLTDIYQAFVEHLEAWALAEDTRVMIFYDGLAGPADTQGMAPQEAQEEWNRAVRNAKPYRDTHRGLLLAARRVLEDPIMQDSKTSQFIQAADMVAYAAFHHVAQSKPEVWPKLNPMPGLTKSYRRLSARWLPDHGAEGIVWIDRES